MRSETVRKAFTDELLALARQDASLFAVATDSRGSVTLGAFAEALPAQFVECGIAEQDAVGIAAGLANGGVRPFVCGPACFYSLRAAEQIKVDVAYSGCNVKIMGVSGGVSYGALGASHHATQDIALLRAVPGLELFLPADAAQMTHLTRYLAASEVPAYVRMGRGPVPAVYEAGAAHVPGKANILRKGSDVSIIACGEMVYPALMAAELLYQGGIEAAVIDMFTLRPLDEAAILAAAEAPLVVTVEEHHVNGGLGSAVASLLAQKKPVPMRILGLPDETLYTGTSQQVFDHYGLTAEGIRETILAVLRP